MTDTAALLQVRHVRLADAATLKPATVGDGEDGVFVALSEPPPVRTVLAVAEGDSRRALEVVRVIEVSGRDGDSTRGFYGRWVDEEALERATKVGTEHLEDGTPQVQPVARDNSVGINLSDAMAMPAPVVIDHEDSDEDDAANEREDADGVTDEAAEAEAPAEQAEPPAEEVAEQAAAEAESPAEQAEATEAESAKPKRRSRGGRRKRGGKRGR